MSASWAVLIGVVACWPLCEICWAGWVFMTSPEYVLVSGVDAGWFIG
jgi:hypothetical protein